MPSAKEFQEALKDWEKLDPRPSLKVYLKQRFPDMSKETLQALLSQN